MVDKSSGKHQTSGKQSASVFGGAKAGAVGLAPAVVLAAAVLVLNPGLQFERGLASAAADEARIMAASAPPVVQVAIAPAAGRTFEEGSEGFWLTRAPDSENVAHVSWRAPVAAGDRVAVDVGAANRQVIDVVSVEQADMTTRIDTGDGKATRYIVTGRSLSAPGEGLIRLTIDADAHGLTKIASSHDRAL